MPTIVLTTLLITSRLGTLLISQRLPFLLGTQHSLRAVPCAGRGRGLNDYPTSRRLASSDTVDLTIYTSTHAFKSHSLWPERFIIIYTICISVLYSYRENPMNASRTYHSTTRLLASPSSYHQLVPLSLRLKHSSVLKRAPIVVGQW